MSFWGQRSRASASTEWLNEKATPLVRDGMQFVFYFPTNININTAKGGSINHGKAS